jgi:carbohydrate-binding DOMON domain-containing protein
MADAAVPHRVVAFDPAQGEVCASQAFRVRREWALLAEADDAAEDERYSYPTDPAFAANRPADLRRVRVHGAGGALRIEVTTNRLLASWNPPHGFDHVAFTVFVELPARPGGIAEMPLQNARLPGGMRWHLRLRAHGWTNALFGAAGASAASEGTPLAPAAAIEVERDAQTVRFTLPASVLGAGSLSGARVYVTTWDYDGGYRALAREAQPFTFGGGSGAADPLVMDDLPPIVVK